MPFVDKFVLVPKEGPAAGKPWTDANKHPCALTKKPSYALVPFRGNKTMAVLCKHCKQKWPHPGGEDLFTAYLAGYRDCRRNINDAADQIAVEIVGMIP